MRKQNKNKVFKKKEDKALRKQKQEERRELVRENKKILFNIIENSDRIIKTTNKNISGNDFIVPNEKYYKADIMLKDIYKFTKRNNGSIFKKIFEYKKSKLSYGQPFKAEITVEEIAITAISMYIIYGIVTGINYNISTKKIYELAKDKNFKELVLNINIDKLIKKYSNS